MAKITRVNGNVQAFASAAVGTERTLFGEVTQSNDLTAQFTPDFLRGWGIVGPSDQPALEDFNGAMYTHGQILAYLHQVGIPEYNAAQEYHLGSVTLNSGEIYISIVNSNVGNPPASSASQWKRAADRVVTKFLSGGTFTVPPGVKKIYVTGCAGGGGGGGTFNIGAAGNIAAGGGGGGAGDSLINREYAVTPGQVLSVAVGGSGAGGAVASNGAAGGATSLGSLFTLGGGGGGGAGSAGTTSTSWAGGPGGAGFPAGGDAADATTAYTAISGTGASGPFGGGGGARRGGANTSSPGLPASGYGAGGSGSGGTYAGTVTTTGSVGGAGAPGILIIEY